MDNVEYLLALHSVNGLGPVRLKLLLDYFEDPKNAWLADSRVLLKIQLPKNTVESLVTARKTLNPGQYRERIEKAGIRWLSLFDEEYPVLLRQIYDPPVILFYKGEFKSEDSRAVAVVGTRKISGYGHLVTEKITGGLCGYGMTIVSGLARGVDTIAHRTTISSEGRTLAVLGGGLNHIFPAENIRLAEEIIAGYGAVISEFPPDEFSLPGNFPARNRIIAGLSLAVVVTEAALDSGSLITAKSALEYGREVFAVPGPITSELSAGPTTLIKQGACLVTSAEEIAEELQLQSVNKQTPKIAEDSLSTEEKQIIGALAGEQQHIDDLCRLFRLPVARISAILIRMEIQGLVKNLGGGNYVKTC